jgi:DNA-binding GntR family transcriptional regulator
MSRLNRAIHQGVLAAAGNEVLDHTVNHLFARVPSYSLFALGAPDNLKSFVESHGRIIEAIGERDENLAAQEMSMHIGLAKQILLSQMDDDDRTSDGSGPDQT